ncbi:MAG: multidrug efflux SMR transporter [Phycisphaerales bacterium]
MAWVYLFVAGLFEIGWPLGLKVAQAPERRVTGILIAVLGMAVSGTLLWLAQRTIPIGTAYAVWTGIGAAGAFCVGIWFFHDAVTAMRIGSVALIIAGVVGLRISHG